MATWFVIASGLNILIYYSTDRHTCFDYMANYTHGFMHMAIVLYFFLAIVFKFWVGLLQVDLKFTWSAWFFPNSLYLPSINFNVGDFVFKNGYVLVFDMWLGIISARYL